MWFIRCHRKIHQGFLERITSHPFKSVSIILCETCRSSLKFPSVSPVSFCTYESVVCCDVIGEWLVAMKCREDVQGQLLKEFVIFVLDITCNKTVMNITPTLLFLNFDHTWNIWVISTPNITAQRKTNIEFWLKVAVIF